MYKVVETYSGQVFENPCRTLGGARRALTAIRKRFQQAPGYFKQIGARAHIEHVGQNQTMIEPTDTLTP